MASIDTTDARDWLNAKRKKLSLKTPYVGHFAKHEKYKDAKSSLVGLYPIKSWDKSKSKMEANN